MLKDTRDTIGKHPTITWGHTVDILQASWLGASQNLYQAPDTPRVRHHEPPKFQTYLMTESFLAPINILQAICPEQCVQCSSVAQSCPTLRDPMDRSIPGLPVCHQLPEFTQTHVHWVDDAIQPFHPLSSPSPAFNLSNVLETSRLSRILDLAKVR